MTTPKNIAASVRERLRQYAAAESRPFDEVLTYYAIERFLFRLSCTPHRDHFVLKGALMLPLWGSGIARATRDIDFLADGLRTPQELASVIVDCLRVDVPPDGLVFDATTVAVDAIREDTRYGGIRAAFLGYLERARINMQVDVVGLANSRMKDFFDVWSVLGTVALEGEVVAKAIRATFARRGTAVPGGLPPALTEQFTTDRNKHSQWSAFVRRLRMENPPLLNSVVERLAAFALPVFIAIAASKSVEGRWLPMQGWALEP